MEKITDGIAASRPLWATVETSPRTEIQQCVQRLLEEEVEALLGRRQSERRAATQAALRRLPEFVSRLPHRRGTDFLADRTA